MPEAEVDDESRSDPRAAAAGASPPAAPRSGSRLTIALGAVLVLALVTIGLEWRHARDLDHRLGQLESTEATRRDIQTVAGAFGQALLTYDFNDLNAARTSVLALATQSFGQQYTTAFTGGLDVAITKLQASSKATIDSVYVADVLSDTAKAIVTLDSEVHSSAGTRRTIGSYLDLTLKREDGKWKVDTVTSVAALDQQTIAPDGTVTDDSASTSTTVVPAVPDTTAASSSPGG